MQIFKDLDKNIENKGDELVITIKGDKEKLAKVEKIMKAMHDLQEACGDECCKGGSGACC